MLGFQNMKPISKTITMIIMICPYLNLHKNYKLIQAFIDNEISINGKDFTPEIISKV